MALHDDVAELRRKRLQASGQPIPQSFQGVTRQRIREVLTRLDLGNNADLADGVFALLDDQTESWFSKVPSGTKFCDGATTAHLACHVGILQRGNSKLDREGRDYWIKPLRELGAIEPVLLHEGRFIDGHPVAKSPNSAYRLNASFKEILTARAARWHKLLRDWTSDDAIRERRAFQADAAENSKALVDTSHSDLIHASLEVYARRFLPGYKVVYVDDGDGDRIDQSDRQKLKAAGIDLQLGDAMPDALLWNPKTDGLWVIEAVTSDGEVDLHKVAQVTRMGQRCKKTGVGFTTTYLTWRAAALRQEAYKNIAIDTYLWIASDPARQMLVRSF